MRRPAAVIVLLTVPAAAWLVGPTARAARPLGACRAAHAVLCTADAPQAMVGGQPVSEGDGVLARDEESGAWWRATVSQIRGTEVLVHYTGCDDAWDVWLDAGSPNLSSMDTMERATADTAFQSDEYENTLANLDDDALLEKYREQRWDDNAKWQLTTFVEGQLGKWAGRMTRYEPETAEEGTVRLVAAGESACSCNVRVTVEVGEQAVAVSDTLESAELATDQEMGAAAFRPEVGNMAVGKCFTFASAAAGGGLFVEVAIREAERRVRCKLAYAADGGGDLKVASVGVVREVDGGGAFVDGGTGGSDDVDGTPGRGLYSPPPLAGDQKRNYCTLYCEGGVTLAFPTALGAADGGCISLDWIAGSMRYQLDRKFAKPDGSLSSLELTEIAKKDAENFPPEAPHSNFPSGHVSGS